MDCIYHAGTDAAATCSGCGKPFCRACLIEMSDGRNFCRVCAYSASVAAKPGPGGLAITSLVLSIISIFICPLTAIAGMVMGFVELGQINRGYAPGAGKGLALAGAIIGSVVTGLMVVVIIISVVIAIISAGAA